MKTAVITSLIVAVAAVTSAIPLEERQGPTQDINVPEGQQEIAVTEADATSQTNSPNKALICVDEDFHGDCKILRRPSGECGEFEKPFDNSISSIKPYKGFTCTFWTDHNCPRGKDALRDVDFTLSDLGIYAGGKFNDRFSSWKCGPA